MRATLDVKFIEEPPSEQDLGLEIIEAGLVIMETPVFIHDRIVTDTKEITEGWCGIDRINEDIVIPDHLVKLATIPNLEGVSSRGQEKRKPLIRFIRQEQETIGAVTYGSATHQLIITVISQGELREFQVIILVT